MKTRHIVVPLPGATPESRERLRRTDELVTAFIDDRAADAVGGEVSFIVHVAADHIGEQFGDPVDFAKLDVQSLFVHLSVGFAQPEMAIAYSVIIDEFYQWLEQRGRAPQGTHARVAREIEEHRDAFVGRAFMNQLQEAVEKDMEAAPQKWRSRSSRRRKAKLN